MPVVGRHLQGRPRRPGRPGADPALPGRRRGARSRGARWPLAFLGNDRWQAAGRPRPASGATASWSRRGSTGSPRGAATCRPRRAPARTSPPSSRRGPCCSSALAPHLPDVTGGPSSPRRPRPLRASRRPRRAPAQRRPRRRRGRRRWRASRCPRTCIGASRSTLWVDRAQGPLQRLVRVLPPLGGRPRRRHQAAAGGGRDGLRRRLPAADPPHRPVRPARAGTTPSTAEPGDVGSPWAIGSAEGGHTAIHPDLGTLGDFEDLVAEANSLGMEVALDYALQCSPDHPWVREHPEWFHHRPDGTIKYAENPPKKYQDIYPINFWPAREADRLALWDACKEILDHWIGARACGSSGSTTPTPSPWRSGRGSSPAVQAEHPDVLFLAEAFTRPKVMAKLAEVGFTQSYTYFTWRTTKHELTEYVDRAEPGPDWPTTCARTSGPTRPTSWPSPCAHGRPAAFRLRLAAGRHPRAQLRASTAATSCARTCRRARPTRSTSTRRSTR